LHFARARPIDFGSIAPSGNAALDISPCLLKSSGHVSASWGRPIVALEEPNLKEILPMRVALTAIAFVAVMLLSACAHPNDPAAFAGWSREKAQAACNAGNPAACNAANNLWGEEYYLL
jgi:hypothetical protein